MTQFTVLESQTMHLDGGSMYGHVPKTLWEKWTPPDLLNRVKLSTRTLLVRMPGQTVLFDAGVGDFFEPPLKARYGIEGEEVLQKNLEKQGLGEESIDQLILSHLHFDHAGGLLRRFNGTLSLRFPNARYYVSKEHFAYAQSPSLRDRASFIPELCPLLLASNRLTLIDEDFHPDFGKSVRFQLSHGHTKGLLLVHFDSAQGRVTCATDLVPGMPWLHLPVTTGYDRFAELVVEEKKRLLEAVAKEKGRLFFTHDLKTPFARISQGPDGKFRGEDDSL